MVIKNWQDGDVLFADDLKNNVRQAKFDSDQGTTLQCESQDISTSATKVPATTSGNTLLIKNNGSADIYVGDSGVSSNDGVTVVPNESLYLYEGEAYVIASSGTQDVRVLVQK